MSARAFVDRYAINADPSAAIVWIFLIILNTDVRCPAVLHTSDARVGLKRFEPISQAESYRIYWHRRIEVIIFDSVQIVWVCVYNARL